MHLRQVNRFLTKCKNEHGILVEAEGINGVVKDIDDFFQLLSNENDRSLTEQEENTLRDIIDKHQDVILKNINFINNNSSRKKAEQALLDFLKEFEYCYKLMSSQLLIECKLNSKENLDKLFAHRDRNQDFFAYGLNKLYQWNLLTQERLDIIFEPQTNVKELYNGFNQFDNDRKYVPEKAMYVPVWVLFGIGVAVLIAVTVTVLTFGLGAGPVFIALAAVAVASGVARVIGWAAARLCNKIVYPLEKSVDQLLRSPAPAHLAEAFYALDFFIKTTANRQLLANSTQPVALAKIFNSLHRSLLFTEERKKKVSVLRGNCLRNISCLMELFFLNNGCSNLDFENILRFQNIFADDRCYQALNNIPWHLATRAIFDNLMGICNGRGNNIEDKIAAICECINRFVRTANLNNQQNHINDGQSTHTQSVHKSVSESAKKLAERYKEGLDVDACIVQLKAWVNKLNKHCHILFMPSKPTLESLPGDVNEAYIREGNKLFYVNKLYAEIKEIKMSESVLTLFNKAIKNQKTLTPDLLLNIMPMIGHTPQCFKNVVAGRAIKRITESSLSFTDAVSQVRTNELLAYSWCALNDDAVRNGQLQDGLRMLIEGLYESQREYNLNWQGKDNGNENDLPACQGGTFNKIMEKLQGLHPDVQIIFISRETAGLKLRALTIEKTSNYLAERFKSGTAAECKKLLDDIEVNAKSIWPEIKKNILEEMESEGYASAFKETSDFQYFVDGGSQTEIPQHILDEYKNKIPTVKNEISFASASLSQNPNGMFHPASDIHKEDNILDYDESTPLLNQGMGRYS